MKDGIIRPFHVLGVPMNDPRVASYKAQTAQSIYDYFNGVLDERAQERRDDLLSHFLDAEVDGERLTREDILDICFLLLIAGLDTVSASLDCFFRYLAEHPDARASLVADPSISPLVVEELLRWETPVMLVTRVATQDTVLSGCPIRAGDNVHPLLGSANTDESEFPNADVVQWGRKANRHIAFGAGIHRCLGSNLARLELRIALRVWHSRIPGLSRQAGRRVRLHGRCSFGGHVSDAARRVRCDAVNLRSRSRTKAMTDRTIQIVFSNPADSRKDERRFANPWPKEKS